MNFSKSYFKSKTLWVGLLTVLAPLLPTVDTIISAYPQEAAGLVGFIFSLLRVATDKPLAMKSEKGISLD